MFGTLYILANVLRWYLALQPLATHYAMWVALVPACSRDAIVLYSTVHYCTILSNCTILKQRKHYGTIWLACTLWYTLVSEERLKLQYCRLKVLYIAVQYTIVLYSTVQYCTVLFAARLPFDYGSVGRLLLWEVAPSQTCERRHRRTSRSSSRCGDDIHSNVCSNGCTSQVHVECVGHQFHGIGELHFDWASWSQPIEWRLLSWGLDVYYVDQRRANRPSIGSTETRTTEGTAKSPNKICSKNLRTECANRLIWRADAGIYNCTDRKGLETCSRHMFAADARQHGQCPIDNGQNSVWNDWPKYIVQPCDDKFLRRHVDLSKASSNVQYNTVQYCTEQSTVQYSNGQ